MSTPIVPPRPQRSQAEQNASRGGQTALKNETPQIPPRPTRNVDPSPDRAAYTRSPLNGPPVAMGAKTRTLRPQSSSELPRRPPSVALPGIGHEGEEYSSFDQLPDEAHGVSVESDPAEADEQTKSVSADLPMHQPKASVPQSTAKRQIQNVTGTDSTQAAAAGIGKSRPVDDVHKLPPNDAGPGSPLSRVTSNNVESRRPPSTDGAYHLRSKPSFNRSTPNLERTTSRPGSVHGEEREHGIPEIGMQVPLLAMAGDVQAPSPAPGQTQHAQGIGFFNDGSGRAHHRKRSSRHEFGPPDSYGIRHDADHQDQFEKEWVRKHPEEAAKEGHYNHLPKPASALTSEQLNRLVQSEQPSTVNTPGTPDESDADALLERVATPNQQAPAHADRKQRTSSGSQPRSPLRRNQYPFPQKNRLHPDDALDDDQPSPRLGRNVDEHEHEHPDGAPIFAADELSKRPNSAYMHAAVTPDPDHYVDEYESDTGRNSRRNSTQQHSRPSSRPSSIHGAGNVQGYSGGSLHRFTSHEETHHSGMGTPLEEIEEYEPLFPEDEKAEGSPRKAFKKRPELAQHHFPSQDVWEDTPASLQFSATVSTPDLEKAQETAEEGTAKTSSTFETPEQEVERRNQNDKANDMTSDSKTFIKPQFKPGVADEVHRPQAHRFPSSDVWEDSPSSVYHVTTVASPQVDEQPQSPEDGKPTLPSIPSRPQRGSKLSEEMKPGMEQKSPPGVPEKPKVPARPARPSRSEQDNALEKSTSNETPTAVKTKPPVPARPGGEKIASLKAGFMSDLNNRLKLGPQGVPQKKEPESQVEEEEQKAPLADARKGRARGPPRRKPAASPAADRKSSFAFSPLIHCWSIDEEDELQVHANGENKENRAPSTQEAELALATNEKANVDAAAPTNELAQRISNSEDPGKMAREHRKSEPELKAALAEAGAAPRSYAQPESAIETGDEPEGMQDESVQTGETEMKTTMPDGEQENVTAYLGGKAAEEGDVVVRDGEMVPS